MNRIPRYRNKGFGLLFSAFAIFMMWHAAKDMFPLDLGNGPLWTKIFVVAFITCWYGSLTAFVLYGLTWLQTLEIDREEIRVCFGQFVVRRIPLGRIKSVGRSVMYSKNDIITHLLVLSKEDRYMLNEKGEKYLKRRRVRRWMTRAGIPTGGRDAAARACLFESRKGVLLKLEWTEEAERILREYLPGRIFLLDER